MRENRKLPFNLLITVSLIVGTQLNATAATTVRVAAVSFEPKKFDLPGNANRLETLYRQAKAGGAQIAVAPEGALDGYVVNEIIAGKVLAESMKTVAVTLDSPVIQRFQQLASELELCLVFGFAERIKDDVFNCAVFIDHTGRIAGKYHKMQFAEGYHLDWWFNRLGDRSRAFDTPFGRCGILICNDRWNPQLARIPVLDGAQFLVIPAYGSRSKKQDEAVLARGKENNVPVIEANVGVTLVVDNQKIVAVDRQVKGITFGTITISSPTLPQASARDEAERQSRTWRSREMKIRYDKTMARVKKNPGK